MATALAEAQRLIAASGMNQGEIADALTKALNRPVKSYTISRIVSGSRQPKADELDALRNLVGQKPQPAPPVLRAPRLTDSAELIPLYGSAAGPTQALRLGEGNVVGVVPVHPAQKGAHEPFAFVVPDNRLADRLMRGETAYALRNRPPMPGQMCLVELNDGSAQAYIYEDEDANTYFLKVKKPKEARESVAKRDVATLHVIVGATFGFA